MEKWKIPMGIKKHYAEEYFYLNILGNFLHNEVQEN